MILKHQLTKQKQQMICVVKYCNIFLSIPQFTFHQSFLTQLQIFIPLFRLITFQFQNLIRESINSMDNKKCLRREKYNTKKKNMKKYDAQRRQVFSDQQNYVLKSIEDMGAQELLIYLGTKIDRIVHPQQAQSRLFSKISMIILKKISNLVVDYEKTQKSRLIKFVDSNIGITISQDIIKKIFDDEFWRKNHFCTFKLYKREDNKHLNIDCYWREFQQEKIYILDVSLYQEQSQRPFKNEKFYLKGLEGNFQGLNMRKIKKETHQRLSKYVSATKYLMSSFE